MAFRKWGWMTFFVFIAFGGMLVISPTTRHWVFSHFILPLFPDTIPDFFPKESKIPTNWVIVDVRRKQEYAMSHLYDAIHMEEDDFFLMKMHHIDKNQPVLVYCSVGIRSKMVGKKLRNAGFQQVFNLKGGIFEWAYQRKPLAISTGSNYCVHPYNTFWSFWLIIPEN